MQALEEVYADRAGARAKARGAAKDLHRRYAASAVTKTFQKIMQQYEMSSAVDAGTYISIDRAVWEEQQEGAASFSSNGLLFFAGFIGVAVCIIICKQHMDAANRLKHKKWLTTFYTENGVKDKLKDVEAILTHYSSNYEQMKQAVEKKYGKKDK